VKTALALLLLLPSLAFAQLSAAEVPIFDQKNPTSIECVSYIPDSSKEKDKIDPAKPSADPVAAYKIVQFQDEKAVVKLATTLGYDIVSCDAPVTIVDTTSKVTITAKALPGECAPIDSKCQYVPVDKDGKPLAKTTAPNNLTFPAGTLTDCLIPAVRKVMVELYGKTSMPVACK
jgi:hypothetical protein